TAPLRQILGCRSRSADQRLPPDQVISGQARLVERLRSTIAIENMKHSAIPDYSSVDTAPEALTPRSRAGCNAPHHAKRWRLPQHLPACPVLRLAALDSNTQLSID